jgi:hypothetical protein
MVTNKPSIHLYSNTMQKVLGLLSLYIGKNIGDFQCERNLHAKEFKPKNYADFYTINFETLIYNFVERDKIRNIDEIKFIFNH